MNNKLAIEVLKAHYYRVYSIFKEMKRNIDLDPSMHQYHPNYLDYLKEAEQIKKSIEILEKTNN